MPIPANVITLWNAYAASTGGLDESRFHQAFAFGDSEALADELARLVLSGTKRATAGALWAYEAAGERLAAPGDLSVVTSWAGAPLCVIETLSVEVVPFRAVTAEFAAVEGEGDGSLAFWRRAHRAYFGRECARLGRVFTEDMPVVCERFELRHRAADGP